MKSYLIQKIPSRLVAFFARPYLGGNNIGDVINTVEHLWENDQIQSTVDLLGEDVSSKDEVEQNLHAYIELIEALGRREYTTLSIKPTAFGVTISRDYCEATLQRLFSAAEETGIPITLDMEDSRYTQVTLDLYQKLKVDYPSVGTVLQTRLFRTPADIDDLQGPNDRIRLTLGIYDEPAEIGYKDKDQMKELLLDAMLKLAEKQIYVEMATHDLSIIQRSLDLIQSNNIPPSMIEYQFLLGVPRKKISRELISKGHIVRLYVPYSTSQAAATSYLRRRMMNNPRLIRYFFNNLFKRN